jgi:RNA polymerase sigma-70 factor (ECF subfamily)
VAEGEDFDALYRSCRDRLVTQLTALTGDRMEAYDLVQEAFARAWTRWDRIASYDDPEGWLRRVAYNLAVGRWRRSRRIILRSIIPRDLGEIPRDHEEISGDRLDVIAALQTLPLSERRAIVLHHLGGLSVDETAAELLAPVGTVKSWLARGRARMAIELKYYEEAGCDPR